MGRGHLELVVDLAVRGQPAMKAAPVPGGHAQFLEPGIIVAQPLRNRHAGRYGQDHSQQETLRAEFSCVHASPLPLVHAKQPAHAPCCCSIPGGPRRALEENSQQTVGIEESLQKTGFDVGYDGATIWDGISPARSESRGKYEDELI